MVNRPIYVLIISIMLIFGVSCKPKSVVKLLKKNRLNRIKTLKQSRVKTRFYTFIPHRLISSSSKKVDVKTIKSSKGKLQSYLHPVDSKSNKFTVTISSKETNQYAVISFRAQKRETILHIQIKLLYMLMFL